MAVPRLTDIKRTHDLTTGRMPTRWLFACAFRVLALVSAIVHLAVVPSRGDGLPVSPQVAVIGIALYTIFIIYFQSAWQRTLIGQVVLDLIVCATLVIFTNGIHGPFVLYSLAPVVTLALMQQPKVTLFAAAFTGAYATARFFMNPLVTIADYQAGQLGTYLTALVLIAALPYIANAYMERTLRSEAKLSERSRIAAEIHDGVCQTVYSLRWQIQALLRDRPTSDQLDAKLREFADVLEKAEKENRRSVEALYAPSTDRPFVDALGDCLNSFTKNTKIQGRLEVEGKKFTLDRSVEVELLCICGEALRNVEKHSKASGVELKVMSKGDRVRLEIADDGCGFGSECSRKHGLTAMKNRATSVGGRMQLTSVPGVGTNVQVEVPMLWQI